MTNSFSLSSYFSSLPNKGIQLADFVIAFAFLLKEKNVVRWRIGEEMCSLEMKVVRKKVLVSLIQVDPVQSAVLGAQITGKCKRNGRTLLLILMDLTIDYRMRKTFLSSLDSSLSLFLFFAR